MSGAAARTCNFKKIESKKLLKKRETRDLIKNQSNENDRGQKFYKVVP